MSAAILVRNHVEDNAITPARPRGRQIGQVVAQYRSRVPVNVIATELYHLSGRPENTERYVGEELGVFQLVDLKCNVAGCQNDMYRASGELNVPELLTRGENELSPEHQPENHGSSSVSDDESHSSNGNASEGSNNSDWSGDEDNDVGEWIESTAGDRPGQHAEVNGQTSQENQRRSVTEASGPRRTTRLSVASSQAESSSASSGSSRGRSSSRGRPASRRPVGRPSGPNKRVRVSSGAGPGRPTGSRTRVVAAESAPIPPVAPLPRPVGRPRLENRPQSSAES
ncbi:hypothetical protein INT47_005867 [Mucor saturninus]|uniref:Uncharacterized protein n=1 Tax=Mucor saturninus TaxID=64648 RepID=A0A8H7QHM5_9FUNG|nr:hypothetical protein INT47_005867 [Mucor saturninus]